MPLYYMGGFSSADQLAFQVRCEFDRSERMRPSFPH